MIDLNRMGRLGAMQQNVKVAEKEHGKSARHSQLCPSFFFFSSLCFFLDWIRPSRKKIKCGKLPQPKHGLASTMAINPGESDSFLVVVCSSFAGQPTKPVVNLHLTKHRPSFFIFHLDAKGDVCSSCELLGVPCKLPICLLV